MIYELLLNATEVIAVEIMYAQNSEMSEDLKSLCNSNKKIFKKQRTRDYQSLVLLLLRKKGIIGMTIKEDIIRTVEIITEKYLKNYKADITFKTVILGKTDNWTYKINYKNIEYNIKSGLTTDNLAGGQLVWVTMPSGNFKNMYISGIAR